MELGFPDFPWYVDWAAWLTAPARFETTCLVSFFAYAFAVLLFWAARPDALGRRVMFAVVTVVGLWCALFIGYGVAQTATSRPEGSVTPSDLTIIGSSAIYVLAMLGACARNRFVPS